MSFASSCAITLPHPLSETILKLGDVRANEPVARLSPVLTGYEQRTLDVVWITDDDLEVGMDQRRELCDLEVALEGEEEGGEGREGQRKVDRIEFYIKNTINVPMFTHIVELGGHGFYDKKTQTAVYTSKSSSSPLIGTRWIRRIKTASDESTLVEEEVTGTCPYMLRWIVQRETIKSQKHHMEGYPSLF
ncbi:hypothetical protein BDY24DRAFT_433167 [Mrakia frigida]|uniref:uncharacterized protein n=1 Tax=Mrakia frigida TaxID=29902 RepID=UPI003FCC1B81